MSTVEE